MTDQTRTENGPPVAILSPARPAEGREAPARGGVPRAGRPGAVLTVVLTGQFMAVLDASIVNVAIPAIHSGLHASGTALQFVVAGYTIPYAVLLVTGARLGDILGHRRVFLAGIALFTLASLGCGLAGSAGWLIGLRFAQGSGAAAMIPQVLSLIQRTFTGARRARAMSRYAAVLAGATVAAQVAGGLLISADLAGLGWRAVFLVNAPIGAVLFAASARYLPGGKGAPGRRLDLPGLALLIPAVLALVLPLVLGRSEHWPAWVPASLGGAVLLFAGFAIAERRVAASGGTPLLPGGVLRLPGLATGIAGLFTVMAVLGGFFFAFALHLQEGLGDSALRAGLTFVPAAAAFGLVSLNWHRVPEAARTRLIVAGFAAESAGLGWLAWLLHSGQPGGPALYLASGLTGAGMAAAFSPLMTRILIQVPVTLAADATGIVVTVNQFAMVVGVATFGTLYLDLAGHLPAGPRLRDASARAVAITFAAAAALALAGGLLTAVRGQPQAARRPD